MSPPAQKASVRRRSSSVCPSCNGECAPVKTTTLISWFSRQMRRASDISIIVVGVKALR